MFRDSMASASVYFFPVHDTDEDCLSCEACLDVDLFALRSSTNEEPSWVYDLQGGPWKMHSNIPMPEHNVLLRAFRNTKHARYLPADVLHDLIMQHFIPVTVPSEELVSQLKFLSLMAKRAASR